ncbi:MAG: hypothetical protein KA100_02475 [Rickettsiales bacterium]|nr:hypothetical protein [Rickettsiales bacterium]
MSKYLTLAKAANPILQRSLNSFRPGAFEIYARAISTGSVGEESVKYTKIMEMSDDTARSAAQKFSSAMVVESQNSNRARVIDLKKTPVLQTRAMDVELRKQDRFGQLIVTSSDDMVVRYGDCGVAPSASIKPKDLLKYSLAIPKRSLGVLDVKNHVPFLVEAQNPSESFAIATSNTIEVKEYDRKEIESRCSVDVELELHEDIARLLLIKMQERIFSDHRKQRFHEEMTLVIDKPTEHNISSGTYMNFERRKYGVDNTTESHYHPGDRRLEILTIGKEAGVTLNFCGISENPDERKDCEVRLEFPPNAMSTLKFPAYVHHKFHGDFICTSVHTADGPNIINALKQGTLPDGFLASATVFSATEENQRQWNLSLPTEGGASKSKGR